MFKKIIKYIFNMFFKNRNKSKYSIKNSKVRIIIDAGHGGKDSGAINEVIKGAIEKEINLKYAIALYNILIKTYSYVALTRSSDISLSVSKRIEIVNNFNPDIMISLHCDSSSRLTPNGYSIYYHKKNEKGKRLANFISSEISNKVGIKSWGEAIRSDKVLYKNGLYILREPLKKNPNIVSVLIEMSFISNDADAERFIDNSFKNEMVNAVHWGIRSYTIGSK